MVFLHAQGLNYSEIGRRLDKAPSYISNVLRQPWARERLAEELRDAGRDELRELLKGAATDAVHKLINLSETANSESVQLGASQAILDRFLGKPNQPLTVANVDPETLPIQSLQNSLTKTESAAKGGKETPPERRFPTGKYRTG